MASSSTTSSNTPAPPPPTPSNHTTPISFSGDVEVALSQFFDQLLLNQTTPTLSSLPPRFGKKSLSTSPPPPPLISLVEPQHDLLLSAASNIGFFHLSDHGIPSQNFKLAMQEIQSLFHSKHTGNSVYSSLGFDCRDEDEEDDKGNDKSLVFDTCSIELDAFPAVNEYAKNLERVGLEVVELMLSTAGLENPFKKGTVKPKCLVWVTSAAAFDDGDISAIKEEEEGGETEKARCYPYVVSLQYEVKASSVMAEPGGWVTVDPCVDSLLVMLGDIAQVWSNGRFKKVRGMPQPNSESSDDLLSVLLLVTLPMDSVLSPLLPSLSICSGKLREDGNGEEDGGEHGCGRNLFRAFSFEEYAWKVYHDQFPFKDPLLRYKI